VNQFTDAQCDLAHLLGWLTRCDLVKVA